MNLLLGLKPIDIARGAAELASKFATSVPGGWGVALTWISAGATLAVAIAEHAMDPVIVISHFTSIVPGYHDAQGRLRDDIERLATSP